MARRLIARPTGSCSPRRFGQCIGAFCALPDNLIPRKEADIQVVKAVSAATNQPKRKRLPDERPGMTFKFSIGGQEGYLNVGLYPDTMQPGEIFVTMAKEGSTMSGLMDAFATMTSIALQHGVPLEDLCRKFQHVRFEPSGFTNDPDCRNAKSIIDYIFQKRQCANRPELPLLSRRGRRHADSPLCLS